MTWRVFNALSQKDLVIPFEGRLPAPSVAALMGLLDTELEDAVRR